MIRIILFITMLFIYVNALPNSEELKNILIQSKFFDSVNLNLEKTYKDVDNICVEVNSDLNDRTNWKTNYILNLNKVETIIDVVYDNPNEAGVYSILYNNNKFNKNLELFFNHDAFKTYSIPNNIIISSENRIQNSYLVINGKKILNNNNKNISPVFNSFGNIIGFYLFENKLTDDNLDFITPKCEKFYKRIFLSLDDLILEKSNENKKESTLTFSQKTQLYKTPSEETITKMYLIAGDKADLLEEKIGENGIKWYNILYHGKKDINAWIKADSNINLDSENK